MDESWGCPACKKVVRTKPSPWWHLWDRYVYCTCGYKLTHAQHELMVRMAKNIRAGILCDIVLARVQKKLASHAETGEYVLGPVQKDYVKQCFQALLLEISLGMTSLMPNPVQMEEARHAIGNAATKVTA